MYHKNIVLTEAALSNVGERENNEDYLGMFKDNDKCTYVLCDGLGGHGKGEVASKFVVESIIKSIYEKNMSVEDAIMEAQEGLLEKQRMENDQKAMKTTVTCLQIENSKAKFVHVGDSRIYHFEDGEFKVRTMDHSVPQMLANIGDIKESDIRHHQDRSKLLRVVGVEWDSPRYQVIDNIEVTDKTSFLMCSDGFWELIEEDEMCATLINADSPSGWLESMRKIVVDNGKGSNMDNYSAIAVFAREGNIQEN